MKEDNILKKDKRNKTKKKTHLWSKVLLGFLISIFSIILIGFGYLYYTFGKVENIKLDKSNLGITSKEDLKEYNDYDKITNIALFGVDSVEEVGRSDSIMIATIDPTHNKLKITSIMRDSYVNIDGHGYDKINHAYAFGGPELSIRTINKNFGLNIEDFASVDFESLPKIIDLLGGVNLDITTEELQYINGYIDDINNKRGSSSPHITSDGPQFVDGVQALAYSRIRYTSGGDYERTHRQRIVLDKLFGKALTISPTQYTGFIDEVLPLIKTSLSANDILSLGTKIATLGGSTLEQERFPLDGFCQGEMIDGVYYLTFDEATTKKQIMNYIFDDKR